MLGRCRCPASPRCSSPQLRPSKSSCGCAPPVRAVMPPPGRSFAFLQTAKGKCGLKFPSKRRGAWIREAQSWNRNTGLGAEWGVVSLGGSWESASLCVGVVIYMCP